MQFLVQIRAKLPASVPDEQRLRLFSTEAEGRRELRDSDKIVSMWRVLGGLRSVGISEAAERTELHERIASLPLYPFLAVDVTSLAKHPMDREVR